MRMSCETGATADKRANSRPCLDRCQAFLFGNKILGLARISGWMRDRQGDMQVLVRHYKKPEETHLGRQVRPSGTRRGGHRVCRVSALLVMK